MLEELKETVCNANLDLVSRGLVLQTFGNVSGVDRQRGLMVIKPSGVDYARLTPANMVVVSLETGRTVEGDLNPSSDTPTHRILYNAFASIGGVVHTHSLYATSWAQAQREIPAFGTTHADYCHGSAPCTRLMTDDEIKRDYEANTGHVIVERFNGLEPTSFPGVLVASHGPFAWGRSVTEAVDHAEVLEYLARLASETLRIRPDAEPMQTALRDKHFNRKHGQDSYYGQKKREMRKDQTT
jgi:L-ribulose-5-phosphate 4-epimerase